MLSAADTACYAAKDLGRSRVFVSTSESVEVDPRRGEMQWVSRLQEALGEDRIRLYVQPSAPIVPDDASHHYDVLVRLQEDYEMLRAGV